ncbi:uncharacterized protein LOC126941709 [Macaca thibetana thibetana]|uniref:uncharacterized protein LOC126941709 n=1 Tax=Macaca thibetana thibetana TaxID=257877 RepID=UPI0021BC910A|nr:uncharacterized protein LOC126941709 [Macaca thibetana thibetana]
MIWQSSGGQRQEGREVSFKTGGYPDAGEKPKIRMAKEQQQSSLSLTHSEGLIPEPCSSPELTLSAGGLGVGWRLCRRLHSAAASPALHPAVRNPSSPTYSRDSKYSCLLPGSRLSTPSLAFHFAPSDPNPPTPRSFKSILARAAASFLPIPSVPALPPSVPTRLLPSASPPAPALSPAARLEPGRDHPGAGVPSRTPAHPRGRQLARTRLSSHQRRPGIYEFVGAEASRRLQPSQPRKSRSPRGDSLPRQPGPRVPQVLPVLGAPHPPAHRPPPRAWRGKGDPGRLGAFRPPPPRRPPGERPAEARDNPKTKLESRNCSGFSELFDLEEETEVQRSELTYLTSHCQYEKQLSQVDGNFPASPTGLCMGTKQGRRHLGWVGLWPAGLQQGTEGALQRSSATSTTAPVGIGWKPPGTLGLLLCGWTPVPGLLPGKHMAPPGGHQTGAATKILDVPGHRTHSGHWVINGP